MGGRWRAADPASRLVARDARVDRLGRSLLRLLEEEGVREEGPRHRDHVRLPRRQDLLGDLGRVDAVGRDERDTHRRHQLRRDPREARARHRGVDRGDARLWTGWAGVRRRGQAWAGSRRPGRGSARVGSRARAHLVPSDASVEYGDPLGLERLRQRDGLFPHRAAGHEVEHRETEDDDELGARRPPHARYDLAREAGAVVERAAPLVRPRVRAARDELVDQVAFGAHHLDTVVPRLLGQARRPDEIVDGLLDVARRERGRREPADRRLARRGRHAPRVVSVTARVQDLHAYLRARMAMHRIGYDPVTRRVGRRRHHRGKWRHAPLLVRRDPARHQQADTALCTLLEEGSHLVEPPAPPTALLEPSVHAAHQCAVDQPRRAQLQRLEELRVVARHRWQGRRSDGPEPRGQHLLCSAATKVGRKYSSWVATSLV